MQKPGILQWLLIILLLISITAYPVIELIYQGGRTQGWTTHFEVEWPQCDIRAASIYSFEDGVWVLGLGDCEPFMDAQFYDGTLWTGLDLDSHAIYQVDQQGRLWRMVTNEGKNNQPTAEDFAVLENGSWSAYASADILSQDTRFDNPSFIIDPFGQPWIIYSRLPSADQPGLWTTGVAIYNNQHWQLYNGENTPELATERIWGPKFDPQARAWFISSSGGVRTYDGTWHEQDTSDMGTVLSVAFDQHGAPWYATSDGLIHSADGSRVIDTRDASATEDASQLMSSGVFLVDFDAEGRAWIAVNANWADGFLLFWDGSNWKVLNSTNSKMPDGAIYGMGLDGDGHVWVVMDGGIYEFTPPEGGSLTAYQPDNLWSVLRGDQRRVIGLYWILPFTIFCAAYTFMLPKGKRLSALGLLIGCIEMGVLLFTILMVVVQSGFGVLVSQLILLMIPLGLLGLLISVGALIVKVGSEKPQRRLAVIGIVLNTLGVALSGLFIFFLFMVGY
jgi:hypothetical protein